MGFADREPNPPRPFPLLLLSRGISDEAAEAMYSSNTFEFGVYIGMFLNNIGRANVCFLRSIVINWDSTGGLHEAKYTWVMKKLAAIPRLRKVVMRVPMSMECYVMCLEGIAHNFGLAAELTIELTQWALMMIDLGSEERYSHHHTVRETENIVSCV
jgi:hypothetical protein